MRSQQVKNMEPEISLISRPLSSLEKIALQWDFVPEGNDGVEDRERVMKRKEG